MISESPSFTSLTGQFLISESHLIDPNFQFTVILIVSHDTEGALGLVVNKPSSSALGDVFPEQFGDHCASHIPIFIGGPVQQEYLFLVEQGLAESQQPEGSLLVTDSVYFVPNVRPVLEYIQDSWDDIPHDMRPSLRFFAGYSGWGSGQLEAELSQDSWVVHSASSDIIFNTHPENGWRDALRKKGGVYWVMGETGSKPSMN